MHNIFTAPSSVVSPIYRAELGVKDIDTFLENQRSQRKLRPVTRQELESIQGDIVEIGQPAIIQDLKLAMQVVKAPTPPEILALCRDYDFGLIELPCAFLPSEGRQFVFVRLEVSFKVTAQIGQTLVYDIYPQEVEEQRSDRSVIIGPDFRFSEGVPGLSLRQLVAVHGLRLEPRIYAAGVRSDRAIWTFEATHQRGVQGLRTLYLVVQKPLSTQALDWHFLVVAELKTPWGVLPISVKRKLQGQDDYTLLWPPSPQSTPPVLEALPQRQGQDDNAKEKQSIIASPSSRTRAFISYSHQDEKYLKELHVHLDYLAQIGRLDFWDDTKLTPGAQWRGEIEQAIKSAKVAVLLISGDFLKSDFIAKNELPPLLDAAKEDGAAILPVIVKPCLFEETVLTRFQAVNAPSSPLAMMNTTRRAQVWVKVAKLVSDMLNT